ncbi:hypothetical protein A4X09_0g7041 [Tilletia walkeri]|uniref:beta-N-acetylhexosaminidase n=1 Tax=Tilletia walkeri TaxID=117179 RepID=A0A8X7N2N6_9BASI|nr:hypothetical protein A4X09_0g7041 [Tilletia walkeri]
MAIITHIDINSGVPTQLQQGIRELAQHPIRTSSPPISLSSSSLQPLTSNGSTDGIAWNCTFKPSRALDKRTLRIHPALTSAEQPTLLITILYHPGRTSNAFRALGHVLAVARSPDVLAAYKADAVSFNAGITSVSHLQSLHLTLSLLTRSEHAHFETIGTMIDCSRNGVLNVASTKFLLRILALLGYNMLQLYTEDTYKIPNEPFFGYLRGGYTFQDTKDIDDYAYMFGIELVPCIQTLGHLGQVLQWPRFLSLRDTSEVLLAAPTHPPTATLVAQMLDAATAPVRSKRIHLGMDETHGLAMGRYHQLYNAREGRDASEVFVRHLQVVQDLCQEKGLKGMIWSDMLFCLHARQNSLLGYYDSTAPPTSTATSLPKQTDLVFWDYYHLSTDSYRQRLKSHRDLMNTSSASNNTAASSAAAAFTSTFNALRARTFSTDEPNRPAPPSAPTSPPPRDLWMAAGSWTWSRFWTALPFTFATVRASMSACKEASSGVDNVFLTIWGDEGNEVDLWSSLPAWTYYAEHGFRKIADLSSEQVEELVASTQDDDIEVDGARESYSAIEEDEDDAYGHDEDGNPVRLSAAEAEVDVDLLRAKFDALCGGNFDDFVVASRVDDVAPEQQTVDDRIHFAPNTSKWLLWEEPFFGFVSPSSALSGVDLQQHYEALATYLLPRIRVPSSSSAAAADGGGTGEMDGSDGMEDGEAMGFLSRSRATAGKGPVPSQMKDDDDEDSSNSPNPSTHPLNARLVLPYLLAQALSLKAGLRRELHEAYRAQNWNVLRGLGGKGEGSRLGRLRVAVEKLWRYHREMWMSMYHPFGWETVELRYGGFRTRLDTMHARIVRFLEHIDAGGQVGVPLSSTTTTKASQQPKERADGVLLDVSAAIGIDPRPVQRTATLLASTTGAGDSVDTSSAANGGGSKNDGAGGTETLYSTAVTELPELQVELELVYGSADQLLDYHRVSRPTYC